MSLPVITPLTLADLDVVMALERICFKDPWTRRMYVSDLSQNELATYRALRRPLGDAAWQSANSTRQQKFRELPLSGIETFAGFAGAQEQPAEASSPGARSSIFHTQRVAHAGEALGSASAAGGPILAYGGFWLMVDEAHIATIATRPEWRGCGLGLLLMLELLDRAIEQGARTSTLEVRGDNLPAQQLYEKLGYAVVGRRRRYYRDGEDGLLMTTPDLTAPAMQTRLAAARLDAMTKLERCLSRLS